MEQKQKTKGRVESYDKEVGSRLRALRKLHNLTQEGLAKVLGITFQQVQKYEQGTNRISAGKVKQIIEFFSVPSSYFFEDNKQKKKIGFAEDGQQPFDGPDKSKDLKGITEEKTDIFKSTETINLLKTYYSVRDEKARKGLMKMVKTYAENIAEVQKED